MRVQGIWLGARPVSTCLATCQIFQCFRQQTTCLSVSGKKQGPRVPVCRGNIQLTRSQSSQGTLSVRTKEKVGGQNRGPNTVSQVGDTCPGYSPWGRTGWSRGEPWPRHSTSWAVTPRASHLCRHICALEGPLSLADADNTKPREIHPIKIKLWPKRGCRSSYLHKKELANYKSREI